MHSYKFIHIILIQISLHLTYHCHPFLDPGQSVKLFATAQKFVRMFTSGHFSFDTTWTYFCLVGEWSCHHCFSRILQSETVASTFDSHQHSELNKPSLSFHFTFSLSGNVLSGHWCQLRVKHWCNRYWWHENLPYLFGLIYLCIQICLDSY